MVGKDDNIKDVIIEISQKMLGITPVLSKDSIELCYKVLKLKKGLSHSPIHPDSIQSKKHKLKVLSDLDKLSKEYPTINWK